MEHAEERAGDPNVAARSAAWRSGSQPLLSVVFSALFASPLALREIVFYPCASVFISGYPLHWGLSFEQRVLGEAMSRIGCLALLVFVTIDYAAAQQPTFRAGVDLVNFGVTVVDKQGNPVGGLKPDDFEVVENGHRQSVKYFIEGQPDLAPPLHLGLLLDTSGSMAGDIDAARKAAVKFVNSTDRASDVTLVDFATQVSVARFNPDDYPRLVERIRMGKVDGMTALYDALGMYLNGAETQDGQKVLVLYTDGGDTRSSLTYQDALDLVKASDVTIYAVGEIEDTAFIAMDPWIEPSSCASPS